MTCTQLSKNHKVRHTGAVSVAEKRGLHTVLFSPQNTLISAEKPLRYQLVSATPSARWRQEFKGGGLLYDWSSQVHE